MSKNNNVDKIEDAQILQKSVTHLKILGSRNVTRGAFHTEDPQILSTTSQSLVVSCTYLYLYIDVKFNTATQN